MCLVTVFFFFCGLRKGDLWSHFYRLCNKCEGTWQLIVCLEHQVEDMVNLGVFTIIIRFHHQSQLSWDTMLKGQYSGVLATFVRFPLQRQPNWNIVGNMWCRREYVRPVIIRFLVRNPTYLEKPWCRNGVAGTVSDPKSSRFQFQTS